MLSIFLIGIALSMDAFSLALGIGTAGITRMQKKLLASAVAIMHFVMPAAGLVLEEHITKYLEINLDVLMLIIFLWLAMTMLIKKDSSGKIICSSLISYFLFAFSVSVDSFSIGLGLPGITTNYWFAFAIFSLCSGTITYLGLFLGECSSKLLKEKAPLLGASILFLLAAVNIVEHFFD